MNAIEKLALQELKKHIESAQDRCHEKNDHRMQHERTFVLRDLREAMNVVKAIEENSK